MVDLPTDRPLGLSRHCCPWNLKSSHVWIFAVLCHTEKCHAEILFYLCIYLFIWPKAAHSTLSIFNSLKVRNQWDTFYRASLIVLVFRKEVCILNYSALRLKTKKEPAPLSSDSPPWCSVVLLHLLSFFFCVTASDFTPRWHHSVASTMQFFFN